MTAVPFDRDCGFCIGCVDHFEKIIVPIQVDISLILGNLITVIFDYQIPHKPLKILSL